MVDIILIGILLCIVGGIVLYLYKAKKRGEHSTHMPANVPRNSPFNIAVQVAAAAVTPKKTCKPYKGMRLHKAHPLIQKTEVSRV